MRPIPLTKPKTPSRSVFLLWLAAFAAAAFSVLIMFDPMEKPGPGKTTSMPTASGTPVRDANAEAHLAEAITWLLRGQKPDGTWATGGPDGAALAVLAILEAGGDPEAARKGAERLVGAFDKPQPILAVAKAGAAFKDGGLQLKAQQMASRLLKARGSAKTWNDDVTDTCRSVDALYAACAAGWPVDPESFGSDVHAWLDSVTTIDGNVGKADVAAAHETAVAMGLSLRLQIGKDAGNAVLTTAVQRIACDLPVWSSADFLYWHYGTQALMQCRQSQPQVWAKWSSRTVQLLIEHQHAEGDARGSWDPVDKEQDRVWTTAINAITLARIIKYRSSIAVEHD